MRRLILVLVAITLIAGLGISAAPQATDSGDKLLAAAKHKARDDGDLPGAIEMYKQIVANAGSNRTLAAAALVGMADCYETLGRPEARATLELVAKDYAATGAPAIAARTKLAAMGQKDGGLIARQVFEQSGTGYYASFTSVSPDGGYLTFTDWNTGELVVRNLTTGKDRVLTPDATKSRGYAEEKVFSPDSRFIAYGWENDNGDPYEMRVISRDGGEPRIVSTKGIACCEPWGWSPDGQAILAVTNSPGNRKTLIWAPAAGGTPRIIKIWEPAGNISLAGTNFKLSPNGKFVAYDRPDTKGSRERDIYVIAADTGSEIALRPHPSNDRMLDWFPDGSQILFASDRGNSWGLWSVQVSADGMKGEPTSVRASTGNIDSHGFTRSGDFYYGVGGDQSEVYTASLAPTTGQLVGSLTRLAGRFEGFKDQAVWSPDGDRLAFLRDATLLSPQGVRLGPVSQTLLIQTVATGEVRPLAVALQRIQYPIWLHDGRSMVVQGADAENRPGLYRVDVETGDVVSLTSSGARPVLSPDDRRVFFTVRGKIFARDLESGVEQDLVSSMSVPSRRGFEFGPFALSLDGKWIATTQQGENDLDLHVFIIPSSGGQARKLTTFSNGSGRTSPIAWSPDSHSVYVARQGPRGPEIWQAALDGAAPRSTGITWSGNITRISVHPDGRRFAISTNQVWSTTWVLQNIPGTRKQ